MEKNLYIDSSHPDETRVVLKSDNGVEEYEYEDRNKLNFKNNIYLGTVSRVEPSLQAAFINFGRVKHGFLAFNDIQSDYYQIPTEDKEKLKEAEEKIREDLKNKNLEELNSDSELNKNDSIEIDTNDNSEEENINSELEKNQSETNEPQIDQNEKQQPSNIREKLKNSYGVKRYKIQEVIKPGQVILLQIVKEERGKKGAALTTFLSLAGKYIVLMPNTAKGGGISKKIFNSQDRKSIRGIINQLEIPETMGLIVRTAGAKKTQNEIKNDLDILIQVWEEIRQKTITSNAPTLIHEEGDVIYRTIRDFFSNDITEVIIDGEAGYDKAKKYAGIIAKEQVKKIKKYRGKVPLFHSKGIEKYLNDIFEPRITLKSGGYLIINQTEALVAIDINSGKSTKERNIEKTALTTNIESATEIARQAKLRDLAGLIVIDFIDMENYSNRRLVEKKLKESLRTDKARVQVGKISSFGLLEMTRQRLRESSIQWRTILSVESFSQKILKLIEEKIFSLPKVKTVSVDLPKKIIDYIKTNMHEEVSFFEKKFKFKVDFVINADFLSGDYKIVFKNVKNIEIEEIKNEPDTSVEESVRPARVVVEESEDSESPEKKPFRKKKFFNKKRKFFKKRGFKKEPGNDKEVTNDKEASGGKEVA